MIQYNCSVKLVFLIHQKKKKIQHTQIYQINIFIKTEEHNYNATT